MGDALSWGGEGGTAKTPGAPSEGSWWMLVSWMIHRALPLRKTAEVMRGGDHFCAADPYKQGKGRGFCGGIVLELGFGAVGFLVNGAQRAPSRSNRRSGRKVKRRNGESAKSRETGKGELDEMRFLSFGSAGCWRFNGGMAFAAGVISRESR